MEAEKSTHNRFKNAIRGNIKSNAQVDSFTKSQEVFKLLQNTLGTPEIPVVSKSFRIPLKHSPSRDTSNTYIKSRNNDQKRQPRNDRNSFDNQYAIRDNSRQKSRGNNNNLPSDRGLFSRRERSNPSSYDNRPCNESSRSSFSNYSRKRSHDDSYSRDSIESLMPKFSDYKIIDRGNNAWRGDGKPELKLFSFNRPMEHNQIQHSHSDSRDSFQYKSVRSHQDMPRGNNCTSVHIQQGISTERHFDNASSNAYDSRSRENCSPSERFPRDRDPRKWLERYLLPERYLDSTSSSAYNSVSRERCSSSERFPDDRDAQKWPERSLLPERHLDSTSSSAYKSVSRERCSSSERFPYDRDAQKWPERSLSPERYMDNASSNNCNSRSRESCSSSERFSRHTDAQKWPTDDNRGQDNHHLNDMCSRKKYESNCPRTDRFAENNSTHSKRKEKDKGNEALDKCKEEEEEEDEEARKKRKRAKQAEKRLTKKAESTTLGKPCKLEIRDKAEPMGKIAEHNVPKLMEAIFKILKETSLACRSTYPKYFGHTFNEDRLIVVCCGYESSFFLRQSLEKMEPLWKGASLGYSNILNHEKFVDAKIPKTIHHFSEFRSLCEEGNSDLNTSTWRLIAYEDCEDDDRRLYTIGMEVESYKMIKNELKGLVRCGDEFINFVSREMV